MRWWGLPSLRKCRKPPNLPDWPSDLLGEGSKPATKSSFVRGTLSKGILLRVKRPKPVLSPTPLSSTVTATITSIPHMKSKPVLSDYHSNLQDLLELHEIGEPVIWPDGLSAKDAKELIKQQLDEWDLVQEGFNSNASVQEGDPSLPAVYTKEATFTAAKLPITITRRKRRFVTNPEELNKMKVTKVGISNGGSAASSSVVAQSCFEDVENPDHQVAQHTTSLDDSDLSLSETDF